MVIANWCSGSTFLARETFDKLTLKVFSAVRCVVDSECVVQDTCSGDDLLSAFSEMQRLLSILARGYAC